MTAPKARCERCTVEMDGGGAPRPRSHRGCSDPIHSSQEGTAMTDEPWMVGYLDQVQTIVKRRGHAVQVVLGGDNPLEQFSYTVGLTPKARPELWIGSLHPRRAGLLLNDLIDAEPADAFQGGALLGGARWTMPLKIRGPVDVGDAEINVATRMYQDLPVACMQVLWPDRAGLYPDQPGYDHDGCPQRLLPYAVGA